MSLDDAVVLEAGRAIRPFLGELIAEPEQAAALDRDLAAALVLAAGDPSAVTAILGLLTACQPAAEWLIDFAESGLPPALASEPAVRGGVFLMLPGAGEVPRARRFVCPLNNDYTWYRRTAAQPIAFCPTDKIRLVPALGGADTADYPRA